eukprot:TRINITY_DN12007_c0_g1_i1.p2 TRINITY_DN12007_c0_g1~~TRINITY_DN12007_c0_g1_i1.p2  ORF type:complete len:110 (-),score=5.71 TRINITY_DN12007_c0_g1_i1:170-454(-)
MTAVPSPACLTDWRSLSPFRIPVIGPDLMASCLTLVLPHQYCQEADGSPAPPLHQGVQVAAQDDMWYEDALCFNGCSTAAYYEYEVETTDVEKF